MNKKKDLSKCPVCGEKLSEADAICPSCGHLVEEPSYDALSDEEDAL